MGGLHIRIAGEDDLETIIALYADDILGKAREAADATALAPYREGLARVITSPATDIYVAERDGEIIGTFQLTFTPGVAQRGVIRATIEAVRTRADLRGQGIGAHMMRFVMEKARANGAGFIQLTSNNERTDAHRFYLQLGFKHSHAGFKYDLRDPV
ncbi:MAG: GNAT family N-acetyltransferase [Beijerinckiaceae bacterium]